MEFATYADKPENGSEFSLTGQGEAMHLAGSMVSANIATKVDPLVALRSE
jgi:hypothetical protein